MKLYFAVAAVVAFALAGSAWTQQSPSDNTAALAASMNVQPCSGTGVDPGSQHQCELRETARLFLVVGQREAALRILCETTPALEVFRPEGALGSGKFDIAANRRCLEVAGIK
ncbi:MAG: hypothetical protein WBW53_17500 [Terriglobales bacterium]